jgi:NADH-quinone oxidoreductase E subunit
MIQSTTAPLTVGSPEELANISFDADFEKSIAKMLKKYPTRQAGLLPLLWMCQERWGWISPGITKAIGERLKLAPAFVEGVITFYTMYQRTPPGKYLLQVCTTLSCQLCGTSELVTWLQNKLGIGFGETTADGLFTLLDVQCLGACGEAPVVQINNDFFTNLDAEKLSEILGDLK